MKILQVHVDFIEYTPIKKEIPLAEEAEARTVRKEELVVLFTAVEEGDDETIAKKAVGEATEFLGKLGVKRVMIYPFAHLSQNLSRPREALSVLKAMVNEAAARRLETFSAPFGWNKAFQIKVKGHPLAEMSRSYGGTQTEIEAPKKKAARQELSEHELFARIRKSDFSGMPDTDHRIIGERMDLFSFYEPSPGMVYWHDKGLKLRNILMDFVRAEVKKRGYIEISTAPLANTLLWRVSGHWEHYKSSMFLTDLGDDQFGLKPMNCPSTFLYYKSRRWSYKDLPLRVADFDQLFRNELSGVATGLFRLKIFTQDDAHIFATEEQVHKEIVELIDLMDRFYKIFGLTYAMKVSTTPDEHLGSEEEWRRATDILVGAMRSKGIEPVFKEKEGSFYGPKIDVDVKDSVGREWQCATIQLDFQMPARFKLTYTGPDGQEHMPAVIHRVIYGSLERFIGILLEHFRGNLPVWMSPVQAKVLSLSDDHVDYAMRVHQELEEDGVRVEGGFETATISYKIKQAQIQKIPFMIIVGKKEEDAGTIAVRGRGGETRYNVKVGDFVSQIAECRKSFT